MKLHPDVELQFPAIRLVELYQPSQLSLVEKFFRCHNSAAASFVRSSLKKKKKKKMREERERKMEVTSQSS